MSKKVSICLFLMLFSVSMPITHQPTPVSAMSMEGLNVVVFLCNNFDYGEQQDVEIRFHNYGCNYRLAGVTENVTDNQGNESLERNYAKNLSSF